MSSLRARCFGLAIRLLVRRRDWGAPQALARRARRILGVPSPYQWLCSRRVDVLRTEPGHPSGEWIKPRDVVRRTILYMHGGGYVACSPATHRPITSALARLASARVFALDYALAPERPFPAALDDAERAYRWLLSEGIPPGSLSLAGDSAGGGLAVALLLRLRDRGIPLPACAVLFSPWTDLTGSGESVRENAGTCKLFLPENISAFATCYAPPSAWHDPGVSPLLGRLDGLPPLHIQVDGGELIRDDATRLHQRVQAAGGSSELLVYTGVFHCWQILGDVLPEAREALRKAARFVTRAACA